MQWHTLMPDDDTLAKNRNVRLWFEDTTHRLFKRRYSPEANFHSQNLANLVSIGAYGNASMFTDNHYTKKGLRYKAVPLGETFWGENHQGVVDDLIRWLRLTPRQCYMKFKDKTPAVILNALRNQSEMPFNFLHRVSPQEDFDPTRLDFYGKNFYSCYVSIEGNSLLEEGGYNTFPYAVGRYEMAPMEMYGRGPAQMVLPALKTLNSQKATFLKQGHRASDPSYLTTDDGIVNLSMRPGAQNRGGMSPVS